MQTEGKVCTEIGIYLRGELPPSAYGKLSNVWAPAVAGYASCCTHDERYAPTAFEGHATAASALTLAASKEQAPSVPVNVEAAGLDY